MKKDRMDRVSRLGTTAIAVLALTSGACAPGGPASPGASSPHHESPTPGTAASGEGSGGTGTMPGGSGGSLLDPGAVATFHWAASADADDQAMRQSQLLFLGGSLFRDLSPTALPAVIPDELEVEVHVSRMALSDVAVDSEVWTAVDGGANEAVGSVRALSPTLSAENGETVFKFTLSGMRSVLQDEGERVLYMTVDFRRKDNAAHFLGLHLQFKTPAAAPRYQAIQRIEYERRFGTLPQEVKQIQVGDARFDLLHVILVRNTARGTVEVELPAKPVGRISQELTEYGAEIRDCGYTETSREFERVFSESIYLAPLGDAETVASILASVEDTKPITGTVGKGQTWAVGVYGTGDALASALDEGIERPYSNTVLLALKCATAPGSEYVRHSEFKSVRIGTFALSPMLQFKDRYLKAAVRDSAEAGAEVRPLNLYFDGLYTGIPERRISLTTGQDLGFRYLNGRCANRSGRDGLNPGYLGECGDVRGMDLRGLHIEGRNLQGSRFDGAQLGWSFFTAVNCVGCVFRGANLLDAYLDGSDFSGADFTGASMMKTNVMESKLTGAIFRDALMEGLDLNEVDLRGADFSNGDLRWGWISDAKSDGATRFDGCQYNASTYLESPLDAFRDRMRKVPIRLE